MTGLIKWISIYSIIIPLILTSIQMSAKNKSDLDMINQFITTERISDRVLVIKTGVFYYDAVTAVATERGIVVFDAGFAPSLTLKYREIIEKEFKRKDFAYLINTHGHWDHTNGNRVFPGAVIVGHKNCEADMRKDYGDKDKLLAFYKDSIKRFTEIVKKSDPASAYGRQMICRTKLFEMGTADLETDYTFDYPAVTFTDILTIEMGDVTLVFHYFGKAHSQSDVVSYIPNEKILMTGDLFNHGGSVNFSELNAGNVTKADVEQWYKTMAALLRKNYKIDRIIDGHGAMLTIDDLLAFNKNVDYLHKEFSKGRELSARVKLENVYHEEGLTAMVKTYNAMKTKDKEKYFYFESSLIDYGYHLLKDSKPQGAVEVFKIVVEQFPESWNAYDCLAEAYLEAGDDKLAIVNYEKSFDLNPDNLGAAKKLKQLKEK